MGVAKVSLKSLPLENMLEAVQRADLGTISPHRAHSPRENSAPAWLAVAQKIKAARAAPLCCGVLYLKNNKSVFINGSVMFSLAADLPTPNPH